MKPRAAGFLEAPAHVSATTATHSDSPAVTRKPSKLIGGRADVAAPGRIPETTYAVGDLMRVSEGVLMAPAYGYALLVGSDGVTARRAQQARLARRFSRDTGLDPTCRF